VWRDSTQRELAAGALRLTSQDLLHLGVIDAIVPEPGEGAQSNYDEAARMLGDTLESNLRELEKSTPAELVEDRYQKFRRMGNFFEENAQGA
jgi:acetyl-CoA carboxylase carboxyl transferase subunit alpha